MIVGRREEENNRLEDLWEKGDIRMWVKGFPGPVVLVDHSRHYPFGDQYRQHCFAPVIEDHDGVIILDTPCFGIDRI